MIYTVSLKQIRRLTGCAWGYLRRLSPRIQRLLTVVQAQCTTVPANFYASCSLLKLELEGMYNSGTGRKNLGICSCSWVSLNEELNFSATFSWWGSSEFIGLRGEWINICGLIPNQFRNSKGCNSNLLEFCNSWLFHFQHIWKFKGLSWLQLFNFHHI